MRGFSAIALSDPKNGQNVGGAMRAAHCYGSSLVVVGGVRASRFMGHSTDVQKTWRSTPVVMSPDVFDALPHDCVPIAVDLVENAMSLPYFAHPPRAFYVFGGEDQTLGRRVLDRCAMRVMIPTKSCMNLAACVNVVLYDRMVKLGRYA